jgi:microsomal dipeptidase-like Zn-dependent dipeptidase
MNKMIIGVILILLILGVVFFYVVGSRVDKSMNVCLHTNDADDQISPEAQALHNNLIIADWHSDVLLWDRDILKRGKHGHTDIPRLVEGNFTLQVFDAVIKTPKGQNYDRNSGDSDNITMLSMANRWPLRTWSSLCERAIFQSEKLYKAAEKSNGIFRVVTNRRDLQNLLRDRLNNKELLGGMLSIEGLHALEGKIENLDRLYVAGYRMLGPVHFFDNEVGGSSAGVDQYGLTDLGKTVIQKMNEKSIIIDLAHASSDLIDDVLDLTTKPIVVSHTGVKGTYDSPRNLSDEHILRIAEQGGVIGIGFWDGAVGSTELKDIVKAMSYVKDLVGIEHVCLGSDWDGATTTYFDAAHIMILTDALMKDGFTGAEIGMIMGGNQIRFLLENLPVQ